MNTWQFAILGNGVEAYEPTNQIQEIFASFFIAAGCPHDMAVFARYDTDENIVTAYFSPSAYETARLFNAMPCEKPTISNLAFIVGAFPDSWRVLFPEKGV